MAVLCFVVFGHLERPHVVPPPLKEAFQLFELAVDGPIVVEGLLSAPVARWTGRSSSRVSSAPLSKYQSRGVRGRLEYAQKQPVS
jgi:hypothetical protein